MVERTMNHQGAAVDELVGLPRSAEGRVFQLHLLAHGHAELQSEGTAGSNARHPREGLRPLACVGIAVLGDSALPIRPDVV